MTHTAADVRRWSRLINRIDDNIRRATRWEEFEEPEDYAEAYGAEMLEALKDLDKLRWDIEGKCPTCGQVWGKERDEECQDRFHYDAPPPTMSRKVRSR